MALVSLSGCVGSERDGEADGEETKTSSTAARPEVPGHLTAEAWTDLVDGLEREAGTTVVYDLIVGEDSADALVPDGEASRTWTLTDGEWSSSSSSAEAPQTVDLATIEPDVVGELPLRALDDLEFATYRSMALSVKDFGDGAVVSVFVKGDDDPATRTRTYDTDGNPV